MTRSVPLSIVTQRAVVLGGTGFVGKELLKSWPTDIHRPIYLIHRSRPKWLEDARVESRMVDLDDPESMTSGVKDGSVLINLLRPDGNGWYPDLLRKLVPTFKGSSLRRCVHASSIDVYSASLDCPINEVTPACPRLPYEVEHFAAEGIMRDAFPDIAILRLGAVFGRGGQNVVSMAEEMKHAPDWKLILRRLFYGKRRMHLVSVEAVCRAIISFALTPVVLSSPIVALITQDDDPANNFSFVQDIMAQSFGRIPLSWVPVLPDAFLKTALKIRDIPTENVGRRFSGQRIAELGVTLDGFESALRAYAFYLWQESEGRGG